MQPAPAPTKAQTQRTSVHRKTTPPPPPPAPLLDEEFRVFELQYGAGATLVLSAHTAGTGAQQKFVTLVAQPDLYGGVVVLLKNVTDGAHLDVTPRMRLIDAVDALADNRGELLFECAARANGSLPCTVCCVGRPPKSSPPAPATGALPPSSQAPLLLRGKRHPNSQHQAVADLTLLYN